MPQSLVSRLVRPGLGIAAVVILWALVSQTVAPDLPSPVKTWSESRRYVLDPFFKDLLNRTQQNWREVVALAVSNGIPVPAFSASLAYYDSYRTERLPANLLQAQRDFFGAHTYERIDTPEGQFFHTDWPEVIG